MRTDNWQDYLSGRIRNEILRNYIELKKQADQYTWEEDYERVDRSIDTSVTTIDISDEGI